RESARSSCEIRRARARSSRARSPSSEPQLGQAGVLVGTRSGCGPVEPALPFPDRHVVDAGVPAPHQPGSVELPELIAIGSEPGAAVIVPLVLEAHPDAIADERPELLDQAIVELPLPFAAQKFDDRRAPGEEL